VLAHSVNYYEPDEVITECAAGYDSSPVRKILQTPSGTPKDEHSRPLAHGEQMRYYEPFSKKHSPQHSGVPVTRIRSYEYFRLNFLRSIVPVEALEKVFDTLTARKTIADASIYMNAVDTSVLDTWRKNWFERRDADAFENHLRGTFPADEEDSLVSDMENRSVLDVHSDGMNRAATALGPFGDGVYKVRVDRFRQLGIDKAAKKGLDLSRLPVHIVNVFNNPDFYGSGSLTYMPALLQKSHLYDLLTNTEVVPPLHFLVQGWAVPGLASDDLSDNFAFKDLVSARYDPDPNLLNENWMRSLTGNSMHWSSIGAFLLFALATSVVPTPDGE
jgi:hypothetical protein